MVGIFSLQAAPTYAAGCTDTFLGMRPWYYDDGNGVTICAGGDIQAPADGDAIPAYVWKIAMNILFDLFLAIGYIAMGFVIYGQRPRERQRSRKSVRKNKCVLRFMGGPPFVVLLYRI